MHIRDIMNGTHPITPIDRNLEARIQAAWDGIAKPIGSFGKLERIHCRIGAIQQKEIPDFNHLRLIICCGDHGIVEEDVSQSGQEVTAICAEKIGNGRSTAGVLMHSLQGEILAVDVGIASEHPVPGTINRRVARGTKNFLREPAMSSDEFMQSLQVGLDLAKEAKLQGKTLIGIGEMGIGNTTSAAVLTGKLLHLEAEAVTGRGAGLDEDGLHRKRKVITQALAMPNMPEDLLVNLPKTRTVQDEAAKEAMTQDEAAQDVMAKNLLAQDEAAQDAMATFCQFGGLELAAMAGIIIGGATYHIPVILDGVLSMVSALVAERCVPGCIDYVIPSHLSREPAAIQIAKALNLDPIIDGDLAAGEGVGAAILMGMLQHVSDAFLEAERFEGYGIDAYVRYPEADQEIRQG